MKKIVFLPVFLAMFQFLASQQDPAAKVILDKSAEITKSFSTIEADFEITITNRVEDQESGSKGILKIKGDKYYLEMMGNNIFFNGTTMWSYTKDINEVVITEPDKDSDDFLENPAKIFTWYNRDFKYRYVGEATLNDMKFDEIDLFPNNLNQPYSRIKVFINKENDLIYKVVSVGKEGIDYTVVISNIKTNKSLDDSLFEFDPSKHKNVEVIDMRF